MKPIQLFFTLIFLIGFYSNHAQNPYHDIHPDHTLHISNDNIQDDYGLDVDQDGTIDLLFDLRLIAWAYDDFTVEPFGAYTIATLGGVADTLDFLEPCDNYYSWSDNSTLISSQWQGSPWEIENKMIAIRKEVAGNYYYGWVRITYYTILDYCLSTVPNQTIYAGAEAMYITTGLQASDVGSNRNGTDLRANGQKAILNESVNEYRLIAVKEESASSFNVQIANQLPSGFYVSVPGPISNLNNTFNENSLDSDGDLIIDLQPYKVFVLSVIDGIQGDSSSLSDMSNTVMLKEQTQAVSEIDAMDIGDFGDGRDLKIDFLAVGNETLVSEYRVMVSQWTEANDFDLEAANNLSQDRYISIIPNGQNVEIQLEENTLTVEGELIESGGYSVFVLSVADGVITDYNALSEKSDLIGLRKPGDEMILAGRIDEDVEFQDFEPDVLLTGNQDSLKIDVDNNGSIDIAFVTEILSDMYYSVWQSKAIAYGNNEISLAKLHVDTPIDENLYFESPGVHILDQYATTAKSHFTHNGKVKSSDRFLAVRINRANDSIYCWFNISYTPYEIIIKEYGFRSTSYDIPERINNLQFLVYPNPVSDYVYLKSNSLDKLESYTLFNLSGQHVLTSKMLPDTDRIDLQILRKGVYILQFTSENKHISRQKIIKK
jgi:hypothetical protein